ncbi:hypothetical protein BST81_17460 [Leptolyngbya sp. 'hensonii']|uniref:methyltransferase n=1 Tax=Leptolyngbya sp. 'hensonii' TaxID=1922337 RepID=UPI0009502FD2|nr:methyltransferase [Leptolyngbya sp. 'hensonii']OLP17138.1 hypothetical protein BST81_17460 [Leptolyngbya sp. 'hensonii']
MTQSDYVFADTKQDTEWQRLKWVQEVFDPVTTSLLEKLGVTSGWTCLEVGAGAGSILRWLCDRVGESGRVVALDLDPRFIAQEQRPNLEIRTQDIAKTAVEANRYDLIHARCVLLHIVDRQQALAHLVHALKPGGWLLLEDPDFTTNIAALTEGETARVINRVFEATRQFYASLQINPALGRQLPLLLQELGLQDIDTHSNIALFPGASPRSQIWQMAVAHLQQPLSDTGIVSEADLDLFLQGTQDPGTWMLDYTMVSAWGQKAALP